MNLQSRRLARRGKWRILKEGLDLAKAKALKISAKMSKMTRIYQNLLKIRERGRKEVPKMLMRLSI